MFTIGNVSSFAAKRTNLIGLPSSAFTRRAQRNVDTNERNAISSVKPGRVSVMLSPWCCTAANNNISISRSFVFDDWRACTPFQLTYDLCRMRTRSGTFQTLGP